MSQPIDPRDGPVHEWFGLTYASYLVLPRSVMQSMPLEWQERFVDLLREIQDAARNAGVESPDYRVLAMRRGRFVEDPYRAYRRAPNWLVEPAKDGEGGER